MLADNAAAEPRLAEIWRFAAEVQMIEPGGDLPVLLPPCPDRVHVMGGGGADAEVRVVLRVAELHARALRHSLDFKRENLQLRHHGGHAVRDHPEVLAAGKHIGGMKQGRELAHGGLAPEIVVATVEEVVVQAVERPL